MLNHGIALVVPQECKGQGESAQEEVDAQAPTGLPWSSCADLYGMGLQFAGGRS